MLTQGGAEGSECSHHEASRLLSGARRRGPGNGYLGIIGSAADGVDLGHELDSSPTEHREEREGARGMSTFLPPERR